MDCTKQVRISLSVGFYVLLSWGLTQRFVDLVQGRFFIHRWPCICICRINIFNNDHNLLRLQCGLVIFGDYAPVVLVLNSFSLCDTEDDQWNHHAQTVRLCHDPVVSMSTRVYVFKSAYHYMIYEGIFEILFKPNSCFCVWYYGCPIQQNHFLPQPKICYP